jgi:acyl-CoA thioesterase II
MAEADLDDLLVALDVTERATDEFVGISPDVEMQRVFGGQVAAQAVVAAGRTAPRERPIHSLHAYFLRPGDPREPIVYRVDRLRDGRSFTTRRVVAEQHGRPIFMMSASFHVREDGLFHQDPMPDVPGPETVPALHTLIPNSLDLPGLRRLMRSMELHHLAPPLVLGEAAEASDSQSLWMKAAGALPDDDLIHVAVAVYASDMTLLDSVLRAHGLTWVSGQVAAASLDHAMWFHGPFRADQWLLYAQHSPSASGGRGLAEGRMFTRDGRLVVSVVQEGLVRLRSTT